MDVSWNIKLEHILTLHIYRRPVQLVWSEVVETYPEAFQWEHRIKGWSRAKKEALIRGDIDGIHEIVQNERKRREETKKKISR